MTADRMTVVERRGENWEQLVVLCAGTPWHAARMPDQHMAECLSRYVPVLYVEPASSWTTGIRNPALRRDLGRPRISREGPGLIRYRPFALPGKGRPGIRSITGILTRRGIRRAVARVGGKDVLAIIAASLADVLNSCEARMRVFYGTDDFVAGAQLMNISDEWMVARESEQLASADLIVAVSETLADRWRRRGLDPLVIPNGCDYERFERTDEAEWPSDVHLPPPIAGFVGHMSDRIDVELLEAVAAAGHSLLLVGPRQHTFDVHRLDRVLAMPNVQWVGEKPFDELPSYLRAMHTGLVPYGDTEFNRASSPLKTLEYLAAGRSVVSTDLPAARWLHSDEVRIGRSTGEFVQQVAAALAAEATASRKSARQAIASTHSWRSRALVMAQALNLVPAVEL